MTEKTRPRTLVSFTHFLQSLLPRFHEAGYSFALWKLPGSVALHFAAAQEVEQWDTVALEEAQPGFLFAPFDPQKPKLFVRAEESFHFDNEQFVSLRGPLLERLEKETTQDKPRANNAGYYVVKKPEGESADAPSFQKLVQHCREEVISGRFEKVVPSRCKPITLPEAFDLSAAFNTLCDRYPAAMVSIFSSPLTGTWIGATPEMLVAVDKNQHFHTTAMAGTQPYLPGMDVRTITWTQKEIEEQALVERYVIHCLKKIRLREFDEHGPKTVIAGNLVHLKTEFEVDMTATNFPQLGSVMLELLHPTSAVCGMPLEPSLDFLRKNEPYDRQYYSGYLGPVQVNHESRLFVNLRCMQLFHGEALVYAGAGVLADSDPEKEWMETELKMNTLLQVIRQK
ncbi:MAG: chorismate-binding protein [Cytophagales bacterium]|nr:chorismate-binding protein [Cytophagales bacterium]